MTISFRGAAASTVARSVTASVGAASRADHLKVLAPRPSSKKTGLPAYSPPYGVKPRHDDLRDNEIGDIANLRIKKQASVSSISFHMTSCKEIPDLTKLWRVLADFVTSRFYCVDSKSRKTVYSKDEFMAVKEIWLLVITILHCEMVRQSPNAFD